MKDGDTLNILYLNIRSLRNKMEELQDLIDTYDSEIHLIVLTETWLYPNEKKFYNIKTFNAVHDCRDTRGGGTSIFIKQGIDYIDVDTTNVNLDDCNILSIYLPKQKLTLWSVYRPPKSSTNNFLEQIDLIMERHKNKCIILGDMNIDLLGETKAVTEYKNIIGMNAYQIQNTLTRNQATRETELTATILDHVITNKISSCKINLKNHMISDHKIMNISITNDLEKMKTKKITRIKLDEQKWKQSVQEKLLNETVSNFSELTEIIKQTKIESSTTYTMKYREKNEWITSEYMEKLKKRDKMYERWKKVQNEYTKDEFEKLKKEAEKLKRNLKKNYVNKKLEEAKGNSKKTWKILNELCGRENKRVKTVNKIVDIDGNVVEDKYKIAQEYNIHFGSVGVNLAEKIKKNKKKFKEEETEKTTYLMPTDLKEVREAVNSLNNNSAPGEDNLSKQDIITLFECIGEKIVQFINYILTSGIFPEELKTAKITPIHKKGQSDDVNNYRPISMLNHFSKIVEKIIKTRLVNFIKKHYGFDSQQYGFQVHSNTLGATVDLLDYITSELDKNNYVVVVYIDLKKAFDTVDIEILLDKIWKMGFRGVCYRLLKTYSKGRKHFTRISNTVSETQKMKVGIAQGSVLGPLEYLIYVHNLKYVPIKSKYFMYADDTVLVMSGSDVEELETIINCDLDLYFEWLCNNKLSVNVEKTVYMIIKQKNKKKIDLEIYLNNKKLKEVSEYNYLGLKITKDMTWNNHIEGVIARISPMVGAIRKSAHLLNCEGQKLLYNSFIEPQLRYLLPCWGNAPDYIMNRLQRTQNKAVKTIYMLNYRTPTEQLYKDSTIMNIEQLKIFEQVKLIYKVKNRRLKTLIGLKQVKECHSYQIRKQEALRNRFARTTKAQDSPVYRSTAAYNRIPGNIVENNDYYKFVKNLKMYVKNN